MLCRKHHAANSSAAATTISALCLALVMLEFTADRLLAARFNSLVALGNVCFCRSANAISVLLTKVSALFAVSMATAFASGILFLREFASTPMPSLVFLRSAETSLNDFACSMRGWP